MIAICEAPALVLLDEVGTGTIPRKSALGVAVVDHFRRFCQAHVLATIALQWAQDVRCKRSPGTERQRRV